MSFLERAKIAAAAKPSRSKTQSEEFQKKLNLSLVEGDGAFVGAVEYSFEIARIATIARRKVTDVPDLTELFAKSGEHSLREIQNRVLFEMSLAGGCFASIRVGGGKTLISLLAPEALNSKKTLLLVPPDLYKKTMYEIEHFYDKHFELPLDRISIRKYSELSQAKHKDLMFEEEPDTVVCDESHMLTATSARGKRFLRFATQNQHVNYVFMSGTIARASIKDYYIQANLALGKNAPVPYTHKALTQWSQCLDPKPRKGRRTPGALCALGTKPEINIEEAQSIYKNRLKDTLGVIISDDCFDDVPLKIVRDSSFRLSDELQEFYNEVERTWVIDGKEIDEPPTLASTLKQISNGFYYKWVWPNDTPDEEWLTARNDWNKAIRTELNKNNSDRDSALLVYNACKRGEIDIPELAAWEAVKNRPEPPVKPVWVSYEIIDYVEDWLKKHDKAIVWSGQRAVQQELKRRGWPLYGAGDDANLATENKIVCSIGAQHKGKNLQYNYHNNLLLDLSPSGITFEQLAGRTHREKQKHSVLLQWLCHTDILLKVSRGLEENSNFLERTQGQPQKWLYGTHITLNLNQKQKQKRNK